MRNRSHLVATTVVTKSGVQTTVYKKPRSAAAPIPPVNLTSAADNVREQLEQTAVDAIANKSARYDRENTIRSCRKRIATYGDETIRRVIAAAETEMYDDLFQKVVYDKVSDEFISDWIMLRPEASEHDMPNIDALIYGLKHYAHLAPQSEPEKRLEQGNAIVRVINFMSGKGWAFVTTLSDRTNYGKPQRVAYIADEGIRDLLTTHQNPGAVADIIIDRDILDAAEVASIADNMSHAPAVLTEGVL